jgi:asparagine synthase (glutamine-hydrolysing)
MCGIAAVFCRDPVALGPLVMRMNALARHRGPDDEGYALFQAPALEPQILGGSDTPAHIFDAGIAYAPRQRIDRVAAAPACIALGHRRLSIVDLSARGHQPMSDIEQRYWIVYNGEIYNHTELRVELEALGYTFVSRSDTEVIITAYRQWGVDCLHRFNGMFAFVLLDRVAKRVFIARDRFGVKPLYLWRGRDGMVAVASEIKQFSALPSW